MINTTFNYEPQLHQIVILKIWLEKHSYGQVVLENYSTPTSLSCNHLERIMLSF